MENRFTALYKKTDDWWIGYVEELPGANTQGKTIEEVRENLKEAVELILAANRQLAEHKLVGYQVMKEDLMVTV
ncbi:MAG: type II toxin-antitoxin system HicB family antitoxin [Nitrospirota bacterium]